MEIKDKILEKSAELFLSIGVKAITMDDVSSSLGMSKKTLYNYFPTKKILIKDTLTFFFDRISKMVEEINSRDLNSIEKWLITIDEISSVVHLDEKGSCSLQIKKYYPIIFEEVKSQQWEIIRFNLDRIIMDGMEDGFFRNDFNADLYIRFYYSSIMSLEENNIFDDVNVTMKNLKKSFVEFQIRAITTNKGVEELERILENEK